MTGKTWLFFGDQHRSSDFYMKKNGLKWKRVD